MILFIVLDPRLFYELLLHPIGLWVYLTDSKGKLVVDFELKAAVKIYQAKLPLESAKRGGFYWHSIRK